MSKIFEHGRPMIYALATFLACVTSATPAHYAEIWQSGYAVGYGFAIMSGLLISIIDGGV